MATETGNYEDFLPFTLTRKILCCDRHVAVDGRGNGYWARFGGPQVSICSLGTRGPTHCPCVLSRLFLHLNSVWCFFQNLRFEYFSSLFKVYLRCKQPYCVYFK